ncbi:MAG: hypothetical protein NWE76_02525, partial [Candidatus Bathyarchaeota archaeon]|nr:hypothetical protein [Candidatus Bathyarchaeota archaeon]
EIAEEVVGETPDKIAARFLLGVYGGKFTQALLTLSDVSNHQTFADTLLNFHSHTMRWRFSPKLQDKLMFGWHAKLEEAFGKPKESGLMPKTLVEVMDILLETTAALKSYSVDGYYTLFNTAAKAVSTCLDAKSN